MSGAELALLNHPSNVPSPLRLPDRVRTVAHDNRDGSGRKAPGSVQRVKKQRLAAE